MPRWAWGLGALGVGGALYYLMRGSRGSVVPGVSDSTIEGIPERFRPIPIEKVNGRWVLKANADGTYDARTTPDKDTRADWEENPTPAPEHSDTYKSWFGG